MWTQGVPNSGGVTATETRNKTGSAPLLAAQKKPPTTPEGKENRKKGKKQTPKVTEQIGTDKTAAAPEGSAGPGKGGRGGNCKKRTVNCQPHPEKKPNLLKTAGPADEKWAKEKVPKKKRDEP